MHERLDEFEFRPDTATNTRVICPCTSEKFMYNVVNFIFDLINLILAGKEDIHECLDEFKFRPDTATNTRVICPCTSEKCMFNVVNTLAPLFLIGSSSFLQVRRTTIKSWTFSKFDQIVPWTAESAVLERLEKSP